MKLCLCLLRPFVSVAVLLAAVPVAAQFNPLAPMGDFNVLIFNDLTADSGDSEGRLAVGGNSTTAGSYSVGDRAFPNSSSYTSYLVRGNSGDFSQVFHGTSVIGGNWTGNGSSLYSIQSNAGTPAVDAILDFPSVQAQLQANSALMAGFADQNTALDTLSPYPTITVGSGDLGVINLSSVDIAAIQTAGSVNIVGMDLSKTVVINVAETTLNFSGFSVYVNSHNTGTFLDDFPVAGFTSISNSTTADAPISRVLWNFHHATSIAMTSTEFAGSILAPGATLSLSGGSINGDVVALSADQIQGGEFHADNYNRNPASPNAGGNVYGFTGTIPEPAETVTMMALACALGAWLRRRFR